MQQLDQGAFLVETGIIADLNANGLDSQRCYQATAQSESTVIWAHCAVESLTEQSRWLGIKVTSGLVNTQSPVDVIHTVLTITNCAVSTQRDSIPRKGSTDANMQPTAIA